MGRAGAADDALADVAGVFDVLDQSAVRVAGEMELGHQSRLC